MDPKDAATARALHEVNVPLTSLITTRKTDDDAVPAPLGPPAQQSASALIQEGQDNCRGTPIVAAALDDVVAGSAFWITGQA
eukprot:COSAG02_NODE_8350_length_2601_cov_3.972022_1_plen_81_part_10